MAETTLSHKCRFCGYEFELKVRELEAEYKIGAIKCKNCSELLFAEQFSKYSYWPNWANSKVPIEVDPNLFFNKELKLLNRNNNTHFISKAVMDRKWDPEKCKKCKMIYFRSEKKFQSLVQFRESNCPYCGIEIYKRKKAFRVNLLLSSEDLTIHKDILRSKQNDESQKENDKPRKYNRLTKNEYSKTVNAVKSGFILKKPK